LRIAIVGQFANTQGSITALAGYFGAARRAGHDLRASTFGFVHETVRQYIPVADEDWVPDLMILLFESWPYLSEGAVAQIDRTVPRSRRLVVDCDGMYSPPVRSGSDVNHPDPGSRLYWAELFGALSDTVLQPCLGPLAPGAKRFLFYSVNPYQTRIPTPDSEKLYDLAYVGNNWVRWHDISWLFKGLAPARQQLGRMAVIGSWWDGSLPPTESKPEVLKFLYSDPSFLKEQGVEIYPAVSYDQVERTMGQSRLHPVLLRPALNSLGFVTPRMFETFMANTVPILPPYFKHASALYGPEVESLYLGYRPAEAVLEILSHYSDYVALARDIAAKLVKEHSYDVRLDELLAFVT
jgi:hypothetical protein